MLGNDKNIFKGIKGEDYQEIIHWTSEWRYALEHNINQDRAERFLQAIIRLNESLKKELSGIIKLQSLKIRENEVA